MFKYDSKCLAFSEIPFKSENNVQKWGARLDVFLANSNITFLVEAKSSRHKNYLIADIKTDLTRIHSK